jgi:hypothetical protein
MDLIIRSWSWRAALTCEAVMLGGRAREAVVGVAIFGGGVVM